MSRIPVIYPPSNWDGAEKVRRKGSESEEADGGHQKSAEMGGTTREDNNRRLSQKVYPSANLQPNKSMEEPSSTFPSNDTPPISAVTYSYLPFEARKTIASQVVALRVQRLQLERELESANLSHQEEEKENEQSNKTRRRSRSVSAISSLSFAAVDIEQLKSSLQSAPSSMKRDKGGNKRRGGNRVRVLLASLTPHAYHHSITDYRLMHVLIGQRAANAFARLRRKFAAIYLPIFAAAAAGSILWVVIPFQEDEDTRILLGKLCLACTAVYSVEVLYEANGVLARDILKTYDAWFTIIQSLLFNWAFCALMCWKSYAYMLSLSMFLAQVSQVLYDSFLPPIKKMTGYLGVYTLCLWLGLNLMLYFDKIKGECLYDRFDVHGQFSVREGCYVGRNSVSFSSLIDAHADEGDADGPNSLSRGTISMGLKEFAITRGMTFSLYLFRMIRSALSESLPTSTVVLSHRIEETSVPKDQFLEQQISALKQDESLLVADALRRQSKKKATGQGESQSGLRSRKSEVGLVSSADDHKSSIVRIQPQTIRKGSHGQVDAAAREKSNRRSSNSTIKGQESVEGRAGGKDHKIPLTVSGLVQAEVSEGRRLEDTHRASLASRNTHRPARSRRLWQLEVSTKFRAFSVQVLRPKVVAASQAKRVDSTPNFSSPAGILFIHDTEQRQHLHILYKRQRYLAPILYSHSVLCFVVGFLFQSVALPLYTIKRWFARLRFRQRHKKHLERRSATKAGYRHAYGLAQTKQQHSHRFRAIRLEQIKEGYGDTVIRGILWFMGARKRHALIVWSIYITIDCLAVFLLTGFTFSYIRLDVFAKLKSALTEGSLDAAVGAIRNSTAVSSLLEGEKWNDFAIMKVVAGYNAPLLLFFQSWCSQPWFYVSISFLSAVLSLHHFLEFSAYASFPLLVMILKRFQAVHYLIEAFLLSTSLNAMFCWTPVGWSIGALLFIGLLAAPLRDSMPLSVRRVSTPLICLSAGGMVYMFYMVVTEHRAYYDDSWYQRYTTSGMAPTSFVLGYPLCVGDRFTYQMQIDPFDERYGGQTSCLLQEQYNIDPNSSTSIFAGGNQTGANVYDPLKSWSTAEFCVNRILTLTLYLFKDVYTCLRNPKMLSLLRHPLDIRTREVSPASPSWKEGHSPSDINPKKSVASIFLQTPASN